MNSVATRGWGTVVGLTVLTATFSVLHPTVLILTPLSVLLLAYAPRRPLWLGLAALLLFVTLRGTGNTLWDVERGWALIVAAWFVAAVLLLPRSRFLSRALVAVAASAVSVAVLFVVTDGFARVDGEIAAHLRVAAASVMATWSGQGGSGFEQRVGDAVRVASEFQIALYPALLALASVTGLAAAWWAFQRLTARESSPLGRLREFRFHDGLVWILILGLALLVAPLDAIGERLGSNLLAFMGALYAVRGVAVLIVLGGVPSPVGWLIGAVIALLLYPFVVATTFVVGLSDTWLDLRARGSVRAGRSDGGDD